MKVTERQLRRIIRESIIENRVAIEMIDRNSQNVYTRVLNNQ